jgi:hypothetical protein
MKHPNKRAESKLLSIWWFLVLILIAGGIIFGTALFYADKIDVRTLEVSIMASRVAGCIVTNGYIQENAVKDILKECGFDSSIIDKSSEYLLKVGFRDISSNLTQKEIYFGNRAFEEDCKIGISVNKAVNYPKCLEKNMLALNASGSMFEIKILAGSNYEYKV